MPGPVIEREVLIEAPAEEVRRTITEHDQVSQWFADRVLGHRRADTSPPAGVTGTCPEFYRFISR